MNSYNTDEVEMDWTSVGVEKMREHIELADYLLIDIIPDRKTVVIFTVPPTQYPQYYTVNLPWLQKYDLY